MTGGHFVDEEGTLDAPLKRPRSSWRVLCSCGWSTQVSEQWMAESAAKLHPKLGPKGTDHVVRIDAAQ